MLLFADSFSKYSSTADLSNNWQIVSANWSWSATGGPGSNGPIITASGTPTQGATTSMIHTTTGMMKSLDTNSNVQYVGTGFWVKLSAAPSATTRLCCLNSSNSSSIQSLSVLTSGLLQTQTDDATLRGSVGITTVTDNTWHWIEWMQSSNGNFLAKCYVDGITQWNNTLVTVNAQTNFDHIAFNQGNSMTVSVAYPYFYDNIAPEPTTGNMPFGQRQVTAVSPTADSSVQFTPDSGGTNFSRVNETSADGDTSYVQDGTAGHIDQYTIGSLPFTPATITAVQVVSRVKNPGVGTIGYRHRGVSSTLPNKGGDILLNPTYQNYRSYHAYDPNTGAAWTPSGLSSYTIGGEVAESAFTAPVVWNKNDVAGSTFTIGGTINTSGSPFQFTGSAPGGNPTTGNASGMRATLGYAQGGSQKLYFEGVCGTGNTAVISYGIAREDATLSSAVNSVNNMCQVANSSGQVFNNSASASVTGFSVVSSTIPVTIGVAVDIGNRRIWFKVNGSTWNLSGTANPATNVGGLDISGWFTAGHSVYPVVTSSAVNWTMYGNFGTGPFFYPMPSGYTAWDGTS